MPRAHRPRLATDRPVTAVLSALANELCLADNLTDETIDEFYSSGRAYIAHVGRVLSGIAPNGFAPEVALDFGCGVGRLTFAMAEQAKRVVGLDVAEGMLNVAWEQAGRPVPS